MLHTRTGVRYPCGLRTQYAWCLDMSSMTHNVTCNITPAFEAPNTPRSAGLVSFFGCNVLLYVCTVLRGFVAGAILNS